MRNYPEWVLSHWAAISVGAAVVGMNSWWTRPEMEFALDDSDPVALIIDGERLESWDRPATTFRSSSPAMTASYRRQPGSGTR